MRKKLIRSSLISNLIFVACVIVYTVFSSPQIGLIGLNPLKVLDNAVFDYNMKQTMTHAPHEDIFVVAIDDYTVDALEGFLSTGNIISHSSNRLDLPKRSHSIFIS